MVILIIFRNKLYESNDHISGSREKENVILKFIKAAYIISAVGATRLTRPTVYCECAYCMSERLIASQLRGSDSTKSNYSKIPMGLGACFFLASPRVSKRAGHNQTQRHIRREMT